MLYKNQSNYSLKKFPWRFPNISHSKEFRVFRVKMNIKHLCHIWGNWCSKIQTTRKEKSFGHGYHQQHQAVFVFLYRLEVNRQRRPSRSALLWWMCPSKSYRWLFLTYKCSRPSRTPTLLSMGSYQLYIMAKFVYFSHMSIIWVSGVYLSLPSYVFIIF